jgi:hypothetical protein
MPQLDLMHFFSQFFWFSIGFSFLYVFILHNIMPSIAMNLKYRQKKIQILASNINENKDGALNLFKSYDSFILRLHYFRREHMSQQMSAGWGWLITYMKISDGIFYVYINKQLRYVALPLK